MTLKNNMNLVVCFFMIPKLHHMSCLVQKQYVRYNTLTIARIIKYVDVK